MVSNLGDSGSGSLRDAIASLLRGGSITFAANLSGQTITLTSGAIELSNSVTIDASTLANGIQINGNANSDIFQAYGGVSVSLNALTLTNGYGGPGGNGGAIFNYGTLVLNNCTLAGNSVVTNRAGGAIQNWGLLFLNGCTLFNNSGGFAGAINNNATCQLQNCTLYGNSAASGNGGAIDNVSGATLFMLQCTVSGNSAEFSGGGIDNYQSQLSIINTIIAGNVSVQGGEDIYNWSGSTNTALGANIVQNLSNEGTVNGDGSILAVDPLLGPLANNGGGTLTMLPQDDSLAIDQGVTSADGALSIDQRGLPRVSGVTVDIGAVVWIGYYHPGSLPDGCSTASGSSDKTARNNSDWPLD
ncbi:MAG TPA: choice-of-anchor Q domain-containing protein [Verrucomicrobiae bacterium]|nr:choice-of-anchor Q domain-containing protein [Verrucomicrobiae bacterium]